MRLQLQWKGWWHEDNSGARNTADRWRWMRKVTAETSSETDRERESGREIMMEIILLSVYHVCGWQCISRLMTLSKHVSSTVPRQAVSILCTCTLMTTCSSHSIYSAIVNALKIYFNTGIHSFDKKQSVTQVYTLPSFISLDSIQLIWFQLFYKLSIC